MIKIISEVIVKITMEIINKRKQTILMKVIIKMINVIGADQM